jgi:hypothetical protein
MKNTANFPRVAAVIAASAWISLGGACTNMGEPRDLMMEEATGRAVQRPIAMKGDASFLAGKLAATATVKRGFERVDPRGKAGPLRSGGPRKQEEESNSFAHVYFGGVSEEDEKAAMESYMREMAGLRAAGSPMPPVTLRVELANHGTDPIEIEVSEVSSELGNFAPRPASLTIPPGATGVLDPMISQLGVTSDDIPLKLTVRSGGKSETQIVSVKNIISESAQKQFDELNTKKKNRQFRGGRVFQFRFLAG